jgi:lysine/ornithine N-monooxygenase
MKKDMHKKLEFVEKYMPVYRAELYKMMESAETRLLDKMKVVKDTIENTTLGNI